MSARAIEGDGCDVNITLDAAWSIVATFLHARMHSSEDAAAALRRFHAGRWCETAHISKSERGRWHSVCSNRNGGTLAQSSCQRRESGRLNLSNVRIGVCTLRPENPLSSLPCSSQPAPVAYCVNV